MVAGNRRVRAAKIAKLETIPAIIRDVDNVQARRITFIENMHRKDLCALEKGKGIAAVYEDVGITKEQAIQYLKHLHNEPEDIKKKAFVSNSKFYDGFEEISIVANAQYQYLQTITQLPETVQETVSQTKLAKDKATMLTHTRLREHPDIQEYIAQKIAPKGVTHKPAQSILRQTLCYCSAFLIV